MLTEGTQDICRKSNVADFVCRLGFRGSVHGSLANRGLRKNSRAWPQLILSKPTW